MNEKNYISGTIEAIFFSNPSNFYKVMLVNVEDTDFDYTAPEIVVTGIAGEIVEGESYVFYGNLTNHPKYGEQLVIERYDKAVPATAAGLIKYFSSDKFKGIGKKTAEKIVEKYPENTLDSILENPDGLDDILPLAKKNSFVKRLRDNHGMEKILSKLSEYGIPSKLTFQIYEQYKDKTLEIIAENPYQLVEDIKGLGFKTADKIAQELEIAADSPQRFRAGLLHILLTQPFETGDTYIEAKNLLDLTIYLLEESRNVELNPAEVAEEINHLLDEGKMQREGTKIFENSLYFAESGIASNLTKMLQRDGKDFDKEKIWDLIAEVENELGIKYDELQKEAIFQALSHQIFILTGGPGTGKTTIINGFIEVYAKLNKIDLAVENYTDDLFPILLAAPTGRASRRMNELTGLPAATLHRHLGLNTDSENGEADFSNDLSGSLLIVDEFSMVDTWLAKQLFDAIPPSMKVLIVGDSDQLPSVGPGQVLSDLLKVTKIPSIKLDKVFRQGENSTITTLAHAIKTGKIPSDLTERKPDRSYFERNSFQIADTIVQIASSWIARGNAPFEFQVLAPMYKGPAGINNLNKLLQELFNPLDDRLEFAFNDTKYRVGDKILHLVNDAESNVFNGDLGEIIELIPAKHAESKQDEIVINFDGQELNYMRSEWYKITLAYTMSIHKSQGSEFQTVIVPMVSSYSRMLERNLLYTAITRAKQSLILLGEYQAIAQAVKKESSNRKTYLIERFDGENSEPVKFDQTEENYVEEVIKSDQQISRFDSEKTASQETVLTENMILSGDFDAMIGMTELDFQIFTK